MVEKRANSVSAYSAEGGRGDNERELRWRFHLAARVAADRRVAPAVLYDLAGIILTDKRNTREAKAAINLIKEAAAIATDPVMLERLNKSLGFKRPPNHHIAVAMSVAAMDIDRVMEKEGPKANGPKISPVKNRVASIVAAMLQEFLAYGIIDEKTIGEKFGYDTEILPLTKRLSRITRLPISIKLPDRHGKLSISDIHYNEEQNTLSRDLILFLNNPSRVCLIKIMDALQQLRSLDRMEPLREGEDLRGVKTGIALHVRGMYLPLAREIGMFQIQTEMQDLLLRALDPKSAAEIKRQRDAVASEERCRAAEKTIRDVLKKKGFGMKSIARITGGAKSLYSIWNKMLVKILEEEEKSGLGKDIPYSRLKKVDILSIHDCLRFRIIIKDSMGLDGEIDDKANEARLRRLNEIFSGIYEPVQGRLRDYLGGNRKPNGYEALQNTFYIGNKGHTGGNGPQYMEIQFVTESMEEINKCSHASHKLAPCGKDRRPVRRQGVHPVEMQSPIKRYRENMLRDTVDRILARVASRELPGHEKRKLMILGDKNGVLMHFYQGLKGAALVKFLLASGGGIVDGAGRPVAFHDCRTDEEIDERIRDILGPDSKLGKNHELCHADHLENAVFPSRETTVAPALFFPVGSIRTSSRHCDMS